MSIYLHFMVFIVVIILTSIVYSFYSKEKVSNNCYRFSMTLRIVSILLLALFPQIFYLYGTSKNIESDLLILATVVYIVIIYCCIITNFTKIFFLGENKIVEKTFFSIRVFTKNDIEKIIYLNLISVYVIILKNREKFFLSDSIVDIDNLINKLQDNATKEQFTNDKNND